MTQLSAYPPESAIDVCIPALLMSLYLPSAFSQPTRPILLIARICAEP